MLISQVAIEKGDNHLAMKSMSGVLGGVQKALGRFW
jgi:hypothetical protein